MGIGLDGVNKRTPIVIFHWGMFWINISFYTKGKDMTEEIWIYGGAILSIIIGILYSNKGENNEPQ